MVTGSEHLLTIEDRLTSPKEFVAITMLVSLEIHSSPSRQNKENINSDDLDDNSQKISYYAMHI